MIQPHDRLCPSSAHDQHVRSEWFPFYIALSDLVRLYQVIIMAICFVSRERAEVTEEHSWVPTCQPICQPLSIRLTHPHISSKLSTCIRSKFNMKCNVCTEDKLRMLCASASLPLPPHIATQQDGDASRKLPTQRHSLACCQKGLEESCKFLCENLL